MAEFNIKDWLANVAPAREQGIPQVPAGLGEQPPVDFPGQPQGGKGAWLKTFLPLLGALAGGALMGHEARPPDAPHGGTIGSKPALAQAYKTMAQAIEKKEQAKKLMEQEMYNRKRQAIQDALQRETFNIRKMLADLEVRKFEQTDEPPQPTQQDLLAEEMAGIERAILSGEATPEQIKRREQLLKKQPSYSYHWSNAGDKTEKVESLDAKIVSLINKVANSEHAGKFTALQSAETAEELDIIYNQLAGQLPVSDIYGGTKANFDALYRHMADRFGRRTKNVPKTEQAQPATGGNTNPLN